MSKLSFGLLPTSLPPSLLPSSLPSPFLPPFSLPPSLLPSSVPSLFLPSPFLPPFSLCIYKVLHINPTLNKVSAIQHFNCDDANKICDEIIYIYIFYMGLSHVWPIIIDWEMFTLNIIHIKKFCVKFLPFNSWNFFADWLRRLQYGQVPGAFLSFSLLLRCWENQVSLVVTLWLSGVVIDRTFNYLRRCGHVHTLIIAIYLRVTFSQLVSTVKFID